MKRPAIISLSIFSGLYLIATFFAVRKIFLISQSVTKALDVLHFSTLIEILGYIMTILLFLFSILAAWDLFRHQKFTWAICIGGLPLALYLVIFTLSYLL